MTLPYPIMLPSLHINGTGRAILLDAYMDAITAINYAMVAIAYTAPHNRDYYMKGREAWDQAMTEHRARFDALEKIAAELHVLAEHCDQ